MAIFGMEPPMFCNAGTVTNQPTFWISTDAGDTYSVAYTAPAPAAGFFYDYPQFCFGGDGLGNYGLWFIVDNINETTGDVNPVLDLSLLPVLEAMMPRILRHAINEFL